MRFLYLTALLSALAGCQTVNSEDLVSWNGAPVAQLDRHPIFLTMNVEVQQLADGTEIRNYVNGRQATSCFANGSANAIGQTTVIARSSSFCSTSFAACNNIFYIKNGVVERYAPVGSGGASCYTNASVRPTGWSSPNLKS